MGQYDGLTPEERARITEIQDLLIDRYVKLREALANGPKAQAREIDAEIKALHREKEKVEESATV